MRTSLLAGLFYIAAAAAAARAAEVPVSASRGVLLLDNGQLIEGTITASGDRYDVVRTGGEIRVRRSQVEFVGRDAVECHRFLRSKVDVGRAQDFLDLAEWCLRNNLPDVAEQEIAAGKKVDPSHPKIELLEARLRLAREQPPPAAPAADAKQPERAAPEAVVRDLPAGSVEVFTNQVQPLLLNYCARAGCHTPQSSGTVRLERIPPNRHAGRKSTQRNLQSVLTVIDRAHPENSKLLTVPIRPHGSDGRIVFNDRHQTQYRQLVQWVYQVAGSRQPPAPPTLGERASSLLEQGPHSKLPAARDAQDPPAGPAASAAGTNRSATSAWSESFPDQSDASQSIAGRPAAAANPAAGEPNERLTPKDAKEEPARFSDEVATGRMPEDKPKQRGVPTGYVPKDAFDPELFNRRFFKP